MYAILASDMDETFIGTHKNVPKVNYEAAHAMQAAGVHFVVATGRPFFSVQGTLADLGTKGDPDSYTITLNGSYVCKNDGTVVASHPLDQRIYHALIEFAAARDLCCHVYLADETLAINLYDDERHFLVGRMDVTETTYEAALAITEPVYKVLFSKPDMAYLTELCAEACQEIPELPELSEIVYSSERYVEFNPQGSSKGSGLAEVAHALGCTMDQTIAVGDSLNDLSMLTVAGLGLVVKGAAPTLLEVLPSSVVELNSTCDDGCIAEIWERFIAPEHE